MNQINIKGTTKITGLIGWPVEHTLSPIMHNAGFAALGLDYCYVPFPVRPAELGEAVKGLRALNIRGINVTIPHKETITKFLDEVRGPARFIGAVNTVVNEKGRLIGYNTDGPGFIKFLKTSAGFNPRGKNVVIFGAGGAARAVSYLLFTAGAAKIFLFDIDRKKSLGIKKALARNFPGKVKLFDINSTGEFKKILAPADLLVNATPQGMAPYLNRSPLAPANFTYLRKTCLVVDLIYNPEKTLFLKEAQKNNLKIFNGSGLLVWQGILSFELFTGKKIKPEIFLKALRTSG